jgi:hypothetical protein
MPKIKVHERALAHLSRGLYRSPASALRELVSNAWDANATEVNIDTNYPNFFQLSVQDNGDGFSREEFERMMKGGIGNSGKRVESRQPKFGRPLIGRLGIGMLGIAQICGSFVVSSQPLHGKGFRATVHLYDLGKSKWDEPNSDLVHDASAISEGDKLSDKIVDIGTYDFDDLGDEKLPRGTRILTGDVTPTFTQAFQDSLKLEGYKPVPIDWRRAVTSTLNSAISLQLLGDYWRLLWELSASCPVQYISDDALPRGLIRQQNEELETYKFTLIVDGRRLLKPVFLKGNPGGYTTHKLERKTLKVYGRPLTFSGYIVVQEGKQLKPDELRGILVRIRNIGVGYYDPSMLDYRFNEGPRSRWVTGEIFVEEGLEDALNIDRDSFNRFHPEFRALQAEVHSVLRGEIFPSVYKNIDIRSKEKRDEKSVKREKVTKEVLRSAETKPVKITRHAASTDEEGEIHSSGYRRRDGVEISVPKADELSTSKASQQLARSILMIFELALLETDKDEQRKKFTDLLLSLLKRW